MQDVGRFEHFKIASRLVVRRFAECGEDYKGYKGYSGMVQRMGQCGTYLQSLECSSGDVGHTGKLVHANFCRSRFCPMCMWRRGLRVSEEVYKKFEHLRHEYPHLGLVFLTLTVKNVDSAADVDIDKLVGNFAKLRRQDFWRAVVGGVWSLEITEKGRGYHPHIHCLLFVDTFRGDKPFLIDHSELSEKWRSLTGDSYVVGVEAVYGSEGNPLAKQVVELCKYPLLMLEMNVTRMVELYPVLLGRRMMGTFGILRGLKLDDDSVDLIGEGDGGVVCDKCGSDLVPVQRYWNHATRQYVRVDVGQEVAS